MTMRLWSLAEANAAIPRVSRLLDDARSALRAVREVDDELEDLRIIGQTDTAEYRDLEGRRELRMEKVVEVLGRFEAIGCEVKDVETGLVDFRAQMGDATVYLCWREGEGEIKSWHSLDGGFAGRKAIPGPMV
jgi:hypothetical protein